MQQGDSVRFHPDLVVGFRADSAQTQEQARFVVVAEKRHRGGRFGIVGAGRDFYEQVIAQQLEGVMAKRLSSRYLPGRRSDAWLKIKPRQAARAHNSLGKH